MSMTLGILLRYAEVQVTRLQHIALLRYLKVTDRVMFAGIQQCVIVQRQVLAQVHVIRIGTQVLRIKRLNYNRTLFYFFQYARIRENHKANIGGTETLYKQTFSQTKIYAP